MRVTTFILYDRVKRSFQENWGKLFTSNEMLSTGKKINRPSDDLIGISRVLDYRLAIGKNDQYLKNVDDAKAFLEFTDSTFNTVTENLQRIKELNLQAVTDTETPETRRIAAKEIAVVKDSLRDLSNSKLRDRYVFSGYSTDTAAFDNMYNYQGDDNHIEVYINDYTTLGENLTGKEAFTYKQLDHEVVPFKSGDKFIHYIPAKLVDPDAPENRVVVAISTSKEKEQVLKELKEGKLDTVKDTFSYDTFMEMTQRLEDAMNHDDKGRMEALINPVDKAIGRVLDNRSEIGARLKALDTEQEHNQDNTLGLKSIVSGTEDADIAETTSAISKAEVALQALRQSSVNMISQTLFDYLK